MFELVSEKKKIRGKRKTVEEKKRKGEERGVEKEH